MQLRGYQKKAVKALPGLLLTKRRVVAVAPTGSGKTVIAAAVIREMVGKRVLWLAHRFELIDQARKELVAAGIRKEWIRVFTGTEKSGANDALITVASVDMFRTHTVPSADVIVFDEAHRARAVSYRKILAALPDAMTLGLTATPWRLDGKGLDDVFDHMLIMVGPTELIVGGHIAQPRTFGVPKDKARELVRGVRSGGTDYQVGQLAEAMMKRKIMGDVVSETARLAPRAPTLVFAVNREHGKALASRFKASGRAAAYLDGETPTGERKSILASLHSGEIDVIVNVDVLSEGFDCPPVKCVALCRPTKSLTRFLQQVGRASRPYRGRKPIVLDHVGNVWRFGLPESEREWSLLERPRGGSGEAPVKMCPGCEAMIYLGATECPECGVKQPKTEQDLEEERIRLDRIRSSELERARKRVILSKLASIRGLGEDWVDRAMEEVA